MRDHSWGLIGTNVLQLRCAGQDLTVKAGDDTDTHIARELRAHREWLGPLHGRVPELVHADDDAKMLVTRYLPGVLVEGEPAEDHPDTYRQAGRLLARLHGQFTAVDDRCAARTHRPGPAGRAAVPRPPGSRDRVPRRLRLRPAGPARLASGTPP